jgi:SagB-type dehydrogenase family enzyme
MDRPAFHYHLRTSYERDKIPPHYLDWDNQPSVFKEYPGIDPIPLPRNIQHNRADLWHLLRNGRAPEPAAMDVEELSRILLLTYSLTGRARQAGGDFYFRSAASAGALYPTEIYAAVMEVAGVEPGLYHFSVAQHGLSPLRSGDLTQPVHRSTRYAAVDTPVLTFFLSAIYFRSSWKYRERAYRYHLMDTGHVAENMALALRSAGTNPILSYDFDDPEVNRLLGLDPTREVCIAVCHVPGEREPADPSVSDLEELPRVYQSSSQVALRETDYRALHEIHAAGNLIAQPPDKGEDLCRLGMAPAEWIPLPVPSVRPQTTPYPDMVFERRSQRNFIPRPLPNSHLLVLLDGVCRDTTGKDHSTICAGFLSGSVEELDPGFYLLDTTKRSMGRAEKGHFMDRMTRVCLGQQWLANAALHFLFMIDLESLEERWGARGYRYAMLSAGRLGERLYLMATALGLGCCGIGAFYDGEAAELLGFNDSSRLLYLVAVGSVKRT